MVSDPIHGSVCKRKKPTHQKKREKPTTDLQTNHDKIMECEETMRPNSRCAQRRVEKQQGAPKKKSTRRIETPDTKKISAVKK
jgi:hypothetical protein